MIKRNLGFVKIILVGIVCFAIGGCMTNSNNTKASSSDYLEYKGSTTHGLRFVDDTINTYYDNENKNVVYVASGGHGISVVAVPKH